MNFQFLPQAAVKYPKCFLGLIFIFTLLLGMLAGLPSIFPKTFPFLHALKVDTDPENMLPWEDPVRVFHREMKKEFSLHEIVVVGIVNEKDPQGVFNPQSLTKIFELSQFAKGLQWPDPKNPQEQVGVVEIDLIAPNLVDNIEQGSLGSVQFEWLMASPPHTPEEAQAVRKKAEKIPFLNGTLISEDGKALCLYLPLTSKDISYKIYNQLKEKIATFAGEDDFYITGLPVAEDTFGVEMFKQMAISAPIAMLVIFLLMFLFFRKPILIFSPLLVAMVSVILTMAILVITGHTVHIMSSMIPIFIMPISVLDSIHVLSEFFDRYPETRNRKKTIFHVMQTLFAPMLFTSLTSIAGFLSLVLTPIPPVQVFGFFVALGIFFAWIITITLIPAYVMLIPEKSLENFGSTHEMKNAEQKGLHNFLPMLGKKTYTHTKLILISALILLSIAVYGLQKIQINDNPTRWFTSSHPIRIADRILNKHFGGTYMAYLALEAKESKNNVLDPQPILNRLQEKRILYEKENEYAKTIFSEFQDQFQKSFPQYKTKEELLRALEEWSNDKAFSSEGKKAQAWDETLLFLSEERQRDEIFKHPEVLRYIAKLQEALLQTPGVGKSNSLADLVKTVHRELLLGDEKEFRIPDSHQAVAQTLITFQNSHRPHDLWHFVTPDFKKSNVWVQLRSGDNKDMTRVVKAVNHFVDQNPPPTALSVHWFGLTYINVVWQEKMVSGMLQAFLGSFLVVFLMMTFLFRSALWGFISLIPLTLTIGLIYGLIGLVGKDYDMPVAVLSSLTLGLAVDFAIHFLVRARDLYAKKLNWRETLTPIFGEPARAIVRNVIVIAVGFLPLLAAPLIPYKTVGVLMSSILLISGLATLLLLPALIKVVEKFLFPATRKKQITCNCGTCILSALAFVALVGINAHQFFSVGWRTLSWIGLLAFSLLALLCFFRAKAKSCNFIEKPNL